MKKVAMVGLVFLIAFGVFCVLPNVSGAETLEYVEMIGPKKDIPLRLQLRNYRIIRNDTAMLVNWKAYLQRYKESDFTKNLDENEQIKMAKDLAKITIMPDFMNAIYSSFSFSKHSGFFEEGDWIGVYLKEFKFALGKVFRTATNEELEKCIEFFKNKAKSKDTYIETLTYKPPHLLPVELQITKGKVVLRANKEHYKSDKEAINIERIKANLTNRALDILNIRTLGIPVEKGFYETKNYVYLDLRQAEYIIHNRASEKIEYPNLTEDQVNELVELFLVLSKYHPE